MEFIRIGTIVKPQGIRGEVKVQPLTDSLNRFLELKEVFVEQNGRKTPVRVMGARVGADAAYLLLERVYDRNAAEALRGCPLWVDRRNAAKLPEGRYFIVDLIGAAVQDRIGRRIGTLREVLQPGANDVFVVSTEAGGELLIPFVDAFVDTVDAANRCITVNAAMLAEEEIREN